MSSNMERAKEWLRREKQWRANNEPTDYLDIAISALEKQMPKAVDDGLLNYSNLPISRCPICSSSGISPYKDRYCYNCGQLLKWEDTWNRRTKES
jgi:hypothetical protein